MYIKLGGQRKTKHNCKTAIDNGENKRITAISLAHLLFHRHKCKILEYVGRIQTNGETVNAMRLREFRGLAQFSDLRKYQFLSGPTAI